MWAIHCDKGRESPIEYLQTIEHPYELVLEQMTVGDYAIVLDDVIKVIIERKTWKDLAATIRDPDRKANHQKLLDLREKTKCSIVYIIEGVAFPAPDQKVGGIAYKSLIAHLHHIMIRDGCSYIQTRNIKHTAETIISLTTSMTTLIGVDGGAPSSNSKLLKERHLRTPEVTHQKIMMKIHGVSATNLPIIKQHYGVSDLVGRQLTSELSELKHSSGKKFGPKYAERINNSAKDVNTHIKMLSEINGVTYSTATEILKVHPMINIVNGQVKVTDLALIKKTPTTKVGHSLADRILKSIRHDVTEE